PPPVGGGGGPEAEGRKGIGWAGGDEGRTALRVRRPREDDAGGAPDAVAGPRADPRQGRGGRRQLQRYLPAERPVPAGAAAGRHGPGRRRRGGGGGARGRRAATRGPRRLDG